MDYRVLPDNDICIDNFDIYIIQAFGVDTYPIIAILLATENPCL